MYIFLLAGSEVVLSAVVLATCNFLCMRKKASTPPVKFEKITVKDNAWTAVCSEPTEMDDVEEKGAREEQEKEMKTEVIKEEEETEKEKVEEVRSESVTVDSQEVEKSLIKPQQNGDMASSLETYL